MKVKLKREIAPLYLCKYELNNTRNMKTVKSIPRHAIGADLLLFCTISGQVFFSLWINYINTKSWGYNHFGKDILGTTLHGLCIFGKIRR